MVTAKALWNAEQDVAAQVDTSDSSLISFGRRAITVYALVLLWSLEVYGSSRRCSNFTQKTAKAARLPLSLRTVIMSE
jgi:hypothetical protein